MNLCGNIVDNFMFQYQFKKVQEQCFIMTYVLITCIGLQWFVYSSIVTK